jgi:hypothetical protein
MAMAVHQNRRGRNARGQKAPTTKHQAPEKHQAPSHGAPFGAWDLLFLWCLVFGAWMFKTGNIFASAAAFWLART